MDVIDVGVCLQGECQTDDVSDRQEGRHCVHQRPDESDDAAAEREGQRVKVEYLESSGNVASVGFINLIQVVYFQYTT